MMNAAMKVGEAFALLQQGRAAQAEMLCRELLSEQPTHAQALHLLAVVVLQKGDVAGGIDFLQRTLEADPNQPLAYCNLGNALREVGQSDAALACYQRAQQLMPDFAGVFYNQGNVLMELRRTEEALQSFDRTLQLQPDHADAHNNRGNALLELGRTTDALESYRRALAVRPDFAPALANYAQALQKLQRLEDALAIYDRLLARGSADLEVLCNRGSTLMALDQYEEAVASFDAALRQKPDSTAALHGRGRALRALKRYEAALADFERAAALSPDSPDVLYSCAVVLRELYRHEEAAQCFARVAELAPNREYVRGNLLHARLQTCDWTGYAEDVTYVTQALSMGKRVCFPGPFVSVAQNAVEQRQCATIFVADKHPDLRPSLWSGELYRHKKIRVAYLSADFREHPVSLLLAGVLERHDRERFETIGIALRTPDGSPTAQRILGAFGRFIDVSRESDLVVARRLRELEIDIAVDLMGFSGNARTGIYTHRPAPVQVNYLGYAGTMALPCIDYIIADEVVIPRPHQAQYAEKVVYLPGSYQPNDCERCVAEVTPTRAQCGLPESGFVFCCFNNHYKINPDLFDIWMRLLSAVTGSVLWLAQGSSAVVRNLRQAAAERGIGAERLIFAPRLPKAEDHLARFRTADLFLDTLPFNAHATASDALWAGLPVLTCQGNTFASRVASSLLTTIGLPELVTSSLDAYEALALRLATEPARLAELRSRLIRNRGTHALFDTERYCRHLEIAYRLMWERSERGEAPEQLTVPAIPGTVTLTL
jgi:predicted O-linked N-acetylglucosamine transferase (SPINDLY family)